MEEVDENYLPKEAITIRTRDKKNVSKKKQKINGALSKLKDASDEDCKA